MTPDADIRYGQPRFDAVGLFVQWLAEQLVVVVGERRFWIRLVSDHLGADVRLQVAADEEYRIEKTWTVTRLNELLETDGRGELLKDEIRKTLSAVREELGL